MGGATDSSQRSSSPLKRRASDLEADSSQKEDVDMIMVPPSEPSQSADVTAELPADTLRSADSDNQEMGDASDSKAVTDVPSIDAQISTITTLVEAAAQTQPVEGDKVWLVSRMWLEKVISRGTDARSKSKVEPEGEIGPIDNGDIIQRIFTDYNGEEHVQLKHGSGMESFELFTGDAWNMVVDWYGILPTSRPIIRYARRTTEYGVAIPNIAFEFHPPIFTIHRIWSDSTGFVSQIQKATQPAAPIFFVSRSLQYVDFLKDIKRAASIDVNRKIRVWRVPKLQPAAESSAVDANLSTPPTSRPVSPAENSTKISSSIEPLTSWPLLVDVKTFTDLEQGIGRELIELQDFSVDPNYNGHRSLGVVGLGDDQALVLDEMVSPREWVSTSLTSVSKSSAFKKGFNSSSSRANSGRNSPAPSGYNTRGRAQKSTRALGTVGLSNLGNTCYMNSALQCLRSVEELTNYFVSKACDEELNPDNPLGNNGEVAEAYRDLLNQIYHSSSQSSVAPRQFKNTIGRHAPAFSNYGQQDSQEFLGFLLDGLQEDLSRVKKKPYIEKPDSTDEMVNNPDAIREMAAKVWDITKKRDDSVIADLFTGLYKSTLVCPICSKVSITFDPFNNLTLQLPMENSWSHDIDYYPLNDKPIRITVDMSKNATILEMKHYLSRKVGVSFDRLFLAEEFKLKFYKLHSDPDTVSDAITKNDRCLVYELEAKPTNWPPRSKVTKQIKSSYTYNNDSEEEESPPWNDPMAEKMLVSVFHRRPNPEQTTRFSHKKRWSSDLVPHFIVLTPEEARDEEVIGRKILEKVATFTTSDMFSEEAIDVQSTETGDADLMLANGSDASSEGKVIATSIDGEDGIVDVSLKDNNDTTNSIETDAIPSAESERPAKPALTFNQRRPKFVLQPDSYLEPEMRSMFSLKYFPGTNDPVASGWNTVDDEKDYQTLASRIPPTSQIDDDHQMSGSRAGSETSIEDGESPGSDSANITRMNDESEEDEAARPSRRALPLRPKQAGLKVGGRRQRVNRRMKTYSKKGTSQFKKSSSPNESDSLQDNGPLIRLGEGILVDWNEKAYDALFGSTDAKDTMRGTKTFADIPKFHDTELTARVNARNERKRNGLTLDDCLDEFGREEILSEADTWYCPRCKEHRRASKKFELWKTPDILIVHLKRFSSGGWRRDKLDVLVDFPTENLDLASRVVETEDGKQEIFDLIAVDDHWGGMGGGHYTAFAKNFNDRQWYEYNDSMVSKISDVSRVVGSAAYLLFYRRRSERPLGGPKLLDLLHKFNRSAEEITDDEDSQESGEGQRPVTNSSLRGSSGALTGVGAVHRRTNRGSDDEQRMVDMQTLDGLPAYKEHQEDDEDAAPLMSRDASNNDGLRNSIEDEGIDMGESYPPNISFSHNMNYSLQSPGWNFAGLKDNVRVSGAGSDASFDPNGSDVVNDNSSASSGSRRGRLADFDNAIPEGPDGVFDDPSPVPDIDDDNQIDHLVLHRDLLNINRARSQSLLPAEFEVPAGVGDDEDQPATDIHVEEGEGLKMD